MKRVLRDAYGKTLTLGELAALPWLEILALPGAGIVGTESCVEMLSRAIHGYYVPGGPTLLDMIGQ